MTAYLRATRHPWACLVFLLPLLIAYEGGVLFLGGADPDALRNGADLWVRWGLGRYGLGQGWAAPVLVAGLLVVRSWAGWRDRPREPLAVGFGMAVESLLFAAGLWALARNFEPLLRQAGLPVASVTVHTPAAGQMVGYIGTGIYEEVLFRLGLFSLLCFLLRLVLVPAALAGGLAAVAGALLFAAAHHVGPGGDDLAAARFLFRATAGLYFTALYVFRGFGVAVGAHAGYDVLVGVAVG